MTKNILLCGVGGQGVLLAAKLMAFAAFHAGARVFTNEIHGMAQRGGSVTASVRFGDGAVLAPLFAEGEADLLFAVEHAEALRHARILKPDGAAVVARQSIIPTTVTTGAAKYPEDMEERIRRVFPRLVYAPCGEEASKMGNPKLANTILLGAAARFLPEIPLDAWDRAMDSLIRPDLLLQGFAAGEHQRLRNAQGDQRFLRLTDFRTRVLQLAVQERFGQSGRLRLRLRSEETRLNSSHNA